MFNISIKLSRNWWQNYNKIIFCDNKNVTIFLLYELLRIYINVKHINRFIRIKMSSFIIL